MADRYYFLHVVCMRLEVEVRLNGIGIVAVRGSGATVVDAKVSAMMLPGDNDLEVFVGDMFLPAEPSGTRDDDPLLEVRLHRVPNHKSPGDLDLMFGHQFAENEAGLVSGELVRTLHEKFRVVERFGTWGFESARSITEDDRSGVEDLVSDLHATLARKDLKRVAQLFKQRITETALGNDVPREAIEDELFEIWGDRMSEPDFRLDPLELRGIQLDIRCGGRLAHPRTRSGRTLITGSAAGWPFAMPVSVANLDGSLSIVR